jgi:hypothetical protein
MCYDTASSAGIKGSSENGIFGNRTECLLLLCSADGLSQRWTADSFGHEYGFSRLGGISECGPFHRVPGDQPKIRMQQKKSPSVAVVYTSNKTFVGADRFTVKCVFPSGDTTEEEFLITVEKPPITQASKR